MKQLFQNLSLLVVLTFLMMGCENVQQNNKLSDQTPSKTNNVMVIPVDESGVGCDPSSDPCECLPMQLPGLQQRIDNARANTSTTIQLEPGCYDETLVIRGSRLIHIKGAGPDKTLMLRSVVFANGSGGSVKKVKIKTTDWSLGISYDCYDYGLRSCPSNSKQLVIANNIIQTRSMGIQIAGNQGHLIRNNTLVGNSLGIYVVPVNLAGSPATIERNIIVSGVVGIELFNNSSAFLSSNDIWNYDTNYLPDDGLSIDHPSDIMEDPRFTDAQFHVAADSPAAEMGAYAD